jgi:hypothetical protein
VEVFETLLKWRSFDSWWSGISRNMIECADLTSACNSADESTRLASKFTRHSECGCGGGKRKVLGAVRESSNVEK